MTVNVADIASAVAIRYTAVTMIFFLQTKRHAPDIGVLSRFPKAGNSLQGAVRKRLDSLYIGSLDSLN